MLISLHFKLKKMLNRWSEVGRWFYLPLHRTGLNSPNPDWLSMQSLQATVTEDERIVQYDPWQCHASEGSLSETRRASYNLYVFVYVASFRASVRYLFAWFSLHKLFHINTFDLKCHTNDCENNFKLSYRVFSSRISPGRLFAVLDLVSSRNRDFCPV